jgi:hypothetical protein
MLIEDLFARGIMTMGPSRHDPNRQVAVFPPGAIQRVSAARAGEMRKFHWIAGEWNFENPVPSTRVSPAYTDVGVSRFSISEDGGWVCMVSPDGSQQRCLTFDPLSLQWIYVLTRGSYGMLRSKAGWAGDQIAFQGSMTMIGIDCEWRMTWTRVSDDEFGFVNEEKLADGSWAHIDEWRFRRSQA